MPIADAVDKAVNECIMKNILSDFLEKQRAEVIAMSILEYDEETDLKKLRDTEYRFGVQDGERRGVQIGKTEGEQKGKAFIIISQLCRKLGRQYTVPQIANELEMPVEKIEALCKIAKRHAPDYDVEKISEEVIRICPEIL